MFLCSAIVRGGFAAACLMVLLGGCYSVKPLDLPRVGTEVPLALPLDLLLELELSTRSPCGLIMFGCPGPTVRVV
jgi:hypothetical protein